MPDRAPQRVAAPSAACALWKNLGTGRGQAVQFAQLYAQNSWFGARKLLVAQADSAIINSWLARATAPQSGAAGPSGGGSAAKESRGWRSPLSKAGSPGDAAGASQCWSYRGGWFPALPRPQGDAGCLSRQPLRRRTGSASSGTRVRVGGRCDARGCASGRTCNRVRAGEKAASRPDAASDGGSPSAR
jgi:hypothetical protein